ncbi:MAG: PorT family protein [Prevotella sp.]|jgi:hypothetical protein|nr:PorT family protein [Prevotella sp.]
MQPNDKIKDLFSAKLTNFGPQPPAYMWDKINASLSADAANQTPARKIAWRKYLSLAAGAAAMLTVAFLLLPYTGEDNALADKPSIDNSKPFIDEQPTNTPDTQVATANTKQPLYAEALVRPNRKPAAITTPEPATNEAEYPQNEDTQEIVSPQPQENKQAPDRANDEDLKQKIAAFEKAGQPDALLAESPHSTGKGVTVSVGGSSGFSDLLDKKVLAPTRLLRYSMPTATNQELTATAAENHPVWPGPRVKIEHRQPISFGLKIDKRLNNKFSVETGIICTYLSSKLTPTDPDYKVEGDLKFYYLGIPLSINYTFVRLGNAEFQLSAGGMIQKDISGKIVGDQQFKDWLNDASPVIVESHISDKISQKHPQLSIMAGAGANYPLYKMLNVYATVGGAYYFDAKNEFRTVFSDKQLQLDLNVGLKMKF